MKTRETLVRFAVHAYPKTARAAHGRELVGTVLDASESSRAGFVVQLRSLIFSGLAARSRAALTQPVGVIAGDAVRYAAIVTIARQLALFVELNARSNFAPAWSLIAILLLCVGPALILSLFSIGRDRATGTIGIAWLAAYACVYPFSGWLWIIPLLGFLVMVARPRDRTGLTRLLWLVPTVLWVIFETGYSEPQFDVVPLLAVCALVMAAPAVALGTAIAWSLLALSSLPSLIEWTLSLWVELLCGTPAVLSLIYLSKRALRRL